MRPGVHRTERSLSRNLRLIFRHMYTRPGLVRALTFPTFLQLPFLSTVARMCMSPDGVDLNSWGIKVLQVRRDCPSLLMHLMRQQTMRTSTSSYSRRMRPASCTALILDRQADSLTTWMAAPAGLIRKE